MKARIDLTKGGRRRRIILAGNSVLTVFENSVDAATHYLNLKKAFKNHGWVACAMHSVISKNENTNVKEE